MQRLRYLFAVLCTVLLVGCGAYNGVTIGVVNLSKSVKDAEVYRVCDAVQTQINRDFYPHWNTRAQIKPMSGYDGKSWMLYITDDALPNNDLGYHDFDPIYQHPYAYVSSTGDWSITMSHEVMEMLVNPYVNLYAIRSDDTSNIVLYDYEVADPVEDHTYAYKIDGVLVSDFVLPLWFVQRGRLNYYDIRHNTISPFHVTRFGRAEKMTFKTDTTNRRTP